jgi:arylsulfatase A-like enzyme
MRGQNKKLKINKLHIMKYTGESFRFGFIALTSLFLVTLFLGGCGNMKPESPPNVIMFVTDDLNDWVGPLGYKQAVTPNLDQLASEGVTFTNAQAPGVYCAPSRTAIWTGLHASTTGCYGDHVFHYDYPDMVTMQMAFKEAGYETYGAGKLYHHRSGYVDLRGWDEYFARSQQVKDMAWEMNGYHMTDVPLPDPYPYSPYYTRSDREAGSAGHLEWGPIDNAQEEDMVDVIRTNWACDIIQKEHEKPFFLAVGMYCPHYPNYSPQKYFDLYDRDSIKLPPYREDDLDDLSPELRRRMLARYKQHLELKELGALEDAVLAYLAAVSFADANLGRIMNSLESSPYKDNTIIIFWSDQGFHHGEKGHWGKHTLWERTSNVPFIWAGKGIARNEAVETTVSLIDIYPTLAEICNLNVERSFDGISLVHSLESPSGAKDRNVLMPSHEMGAYSIINMNWRYIYNPDGSEELYNVREDPNEWYNLAGDEKYSQVIQELKKSAPEKFAEEATPRNTLNLIVDGDAFHWEAKK